MRALVGKGLVREQFASTNFSLPSQHFADALIYIKSPRPRFSVLDVASNKRLSDNITSANDRLNSVRTLRKFYVFSFMVIALIKLRTLKFEIQTHLRESYKSTHVEK